ncbi:WAS/WASL-interacting protein family member 1-like isoform X2 [Strigops habroptila]|uniref:WAS/WASL-interacting protein family member 1-like isoform X2 n=1 Tax=Strigops habroptila TaxID=2489341 RepID=UPI0011CFA8AC|nr:WAS/WASL-interacting protein family member 1-like isoform X2 [Strigops habroptila]
MARPPRTDTPSGSTHTHPSPSPRPAGNLPPRAAGSPPPPSPFSNWGRYHTQPHQRGCRPLRQVQARRAGRGWDPGRSRGGGVPLPRRLPERFPPSAQRCFIISCPSCDARRPLYGNLKGTFMRRRTPPNGPTESKRRAAPLTANRPHLLTPYRPQPCGSRLTLMPLTCTISRRRDRSRPDRPHRPDPGIVGRSPLKKKQAGAGI